MADSKVDHYNVIPLSIQREGQDYIIGNKELGNFYQFPEEGRKIVEYLQQGESIDAIKTRCAQEFTEAIDVDDFIAMLLEIGFIYPADVHQPAPPVAAPAAPSHISGRRWQFSANKKFAAMVFSPVALCVYLAIIGYSIFLAVQNPQLRLNPTALYFKDNLTLTFIILIVLGAVITFIHETSHMLAAAKHGIDSNLGLGNRMWHIVMEADLTGIFSLPKKQRYLPLLAGMMSDLLCIALITLLLHLVLSMQGHPFLVQILQALALQTLFTIIWQFNLFLKTDMYFVLCNYFSLQTLDTDARVYLRNLFFKLSRGRFGTAGVPNQKNLRVLRSFSWIWFLGRVISVYVLIVVFFPTFFNYMADVKNAAFAGGNPHWSSILDVVLFLLLTALFMGGGVYFWLKEKSLFIFKGNRNVASNP